jgi:hypothetical protein
MYSLIIHFELVDKNYILSENNPVRNFANGSIMSFKGYHYSSLDYVNLSIDDVFKCITYLQGLKKSHEIELRYKE